MERKSETVVEALDRAIDIFMNLSREELLQLLKKIEEK